jgi:hypothetical protein
MIQSADRTRGELAELDGSEIDTSPQKLLGIATLGALGALALYYIYYSLGEETRQSIRDNVASTLKSNLSKMMV